MAGQGSEIAGGAAAPSATTLVISPRPALATGVIDGDPPLVSGTVIDGRYRVVREIGAGGMGRVYEAEHMFLRRGMALKLLRRGLATAPEATARLIQEAMLAGQVPHATIVRVFDCAALADGQVYLAMELLRGESLEQRLRRPGCAAEVVPLLAELARGLAAVHRVGVVHRDIKPANVFLANGEAGVQAKLLDFGVAKLLPGATTDAAVRTQAGAVLGTPYYLAPEQARGGSIDGRADLYALGVILYETLTGTLPFLGDSFMAILARHLHEAPLDPRQAAPERGIPDGVAQLTMRLLAKDPEGRVSDGDALAEALTALMVSEGVALERVALGGRAHAAGMGATTVAPAGAQGLAEGTGAATQRVEHGLAGGTGAATQRVEHGLAGGTGAARVEHGLVGGTGAARVGRRRWWPGGLVFGAALLASGAGIGWSLRWRGAGPVEEPGGRSEADASVVSDAERASAPAGAAAPAGPVEVVRPAVVPVAVAPGEPAKGSAGGPVGAAKKPRPGKKKPSEGGTTQAPSPKTGGDPPLKPDVYDL